MKETRKKEAITVTTSSFCTILNTNMYMNFGTRIHVNRGQELWVCGIRKLEDFRERDKKE